MTTKKTANESEKDQDQGNAPEGAQKTTEAAERLRKQVHKHFRAEAGQVRAAVRGYLDRGWRVVPVPRNQKGSVLKGWQNLHITPEELDTHFPADTPVNVGLLLGEPSGGLVDVDLDCPQAVALAPRLLPQTGLTHGRPGNPRSHWWYVVDRAPDKASTGFEDTDGEKLVELRSTGGQTLVPPSTHPDREALAWEQEGDPARVDAASLLEAVRRLAAAALLVRHWPEEGSRQGVAMALAGGLLSAGWKKPEITDFLKAVVEVAGDEESGKRLQVVVRSATRAQEGKELTGWPTLAKLIGEEAVGRVRACLGCGKKPRRRREKAEQPAPRTKQSHELIALVEHSGAELFHDAQHQAYLAVDLSGCRATFQVGSRPLRHWLSSLAYREAGISPGRRGMEEAEGVLTGRAVHEGPQREVHLRVAGHEGKVYLDLGDPTWSAVEVDAEGWRVVGRPPVYFRRPAGMRALPEPHHGGDLHALRHILNLGDERNWKLAVGWLLACLWPGGPYPALVLHGEQGSAKSTTARGLRLLADPHTTPLRAAPREERDLAVAAHNSWVIGYDNLSDIRDWLSDALCRVATGGGFGSRTLYTDKEETVLAATRPVLVNGIAVEMVSRPDLLDRALVLELPAISERSRRPEREVWGRLEAEAPRLLGALLDAVSAGLRCLGSVRLEELPRMADFALWVEACGSSLGWKPGEFGAACREMREELEGQALGLWPVAPILERLLGKRGRFEGTVGDLLKRLNKERNKEDGWVGDWPRTAKGLGSELRRYTPSLRRAGVEVRWLKRGNRGSRVRVWRAVAEAPGAARKSAS